MRFCSILAAVCFAVRPIAAHPFPQAAGATIQRAAYFLDNNPSGCSIISLKIAQDGTLSNPVKAPTGGSGALAKWVISDPPPPDNTGLSGPDGLFSADAVVVSGQFLFSVNAGSNTLSMFTIDPTNAQKLTLVGKPANTLGEFPVSVAYSAKLNTGTSKIRTAYPVQILTDYFQLASSMAARNQVSPASPSTRPKA